VVADPTGNRQQEQRPARFQTKLFAVVACFVLAGSLIFTGFFGYHQYRSQVAALLTEGNLLTRLLAHNIRLAVFAANRSQVAEIAQGVLAYPEVLAVAVYDAEGQLLAQAARPADNGERPVLATQVPANAPPGVQSGAGYLKFSAAVMGSGAFTDNDGLLFADERQRPAEVRLGSVQLYLDESAMHERLWFLLLTAGSAVAALLVIGLAAAYLVARSMTRPLEHLTDGVAALEEGDLAVTVPVETNDEIGRLARSFNSMVAALRQRTGEREAADQQVRVMNSLLEEKVRQRTAALETANRELEAFNYSASHDLRAPLGRLEGFCKALREDCADQLGANGQHYLQRIAATGEQMSRVVVAMTSLFQVQHRKVVFQDVNLADMARAILAELQDAEQDREVTVVTAPVVTARGDLALLRVALENLLGNAWKFTTQQAWATIEFGCFEQAGETVYFVRDNGAGFDMTYADKLFVPFQRLHSFEAFPGTGVGLAIVQRIVARHEGKIWLESEEGEGTTCFFTLGSMPTTPDRAAAEGLWPS
jgi:signal transduction histidine kinase